VDAVWFVNGEAHAFEVIVESRDNLISHLEACFIRSDKVATLTVVVTQKRYMATYEQELDVAVQLLPYRPCIRLDTVDTLIQELWP
jgi:hypothetical protein